MSYHRVWQEPMFNFHIDAHMHFDLYKNRDTVLNFIEENKSFTFAMTNLPELYVKYIKQFRRYKFVKLALGFHPELVFEYSDQIELFLELTPTTRYIGEIGLDFSYSNKENQKKQIEVFSQIIEKCSHEKNKVLSIHSRCASKEVINIMKYFEGKAILHWYTGNNTELNCAVERGYYFSINNQMLKSKSGRDIISKIPLNKILLESDAPFTKGMKEKYNLYFNNELFLFFAKLYNLDEELIKKRIKANFIKLIN